MTREWLHLASLTYRQARKVVIFVVGITVVLIGVALLVLPGPGWLIIFLGLGVLAIEFAWARRWLRTLKQTAVNGMQQVKRVLGRGQAGGASEPVEIEPARRDRSGIAIELSDDRSA